MNAIRKDFFREIRKSSGRFLSILFIVALGVAFFSGIRSSEPDMRLTGDAYFDGAELMDIKVIGTLGITEDDVQAFQEMEQIERAEGAYSADFLTVFEDKQIALHVLSMSEEMNRAEVTTGRFPEKAGECLADDALGYEVGDEIVLKSGSDDPVTDTLKTETLKVVGTGSSPFYISFSRGSTTIGTGSVGGFLLVPEETFELDVYTEAYLQVAGAKEKIAYTAAYEDLVDDVMEEVKTLAGERGIIRRRDLVDDATKELDKARVDLEEGRRQAEEELADAQEKITDAREQIADAKQQISDGWAQIESAKTALRNSQEELDARRKEYEEGFAQVQAGKAQYEEGKAAFEAAKPGALQAIAENEEKLAPLESLLGQLEGGLQAVLGQIQELESAEPLMPAEPEEPQIPVRGEESEEEYQKKYEEWEEAHARWELDHKKWQEDILAWETAHEEWRLNLEALEAEAEKIRQSIAGVRVIYDPARAQIDAAKKQLEDTEAQLAETKALLDEKEEKLAGVPEVLQSGQEQIDAGWAEIYEQEENLRSGEAEVAENETKLADAEKELEEGRTEAADELAEGEEKIADAEAEIAEIPEAEWYIYDRSTLPEYSGFGENADRMKAIGQVFPVLFFLVAALISLTSMTRMVEEQRIQIGTLKALGYSKFRIMSKYLGYALLATILGSIIGVLTGEKILPYIIIYAYGIMYQHITDIQIPYVASYAVAASAAAIVCTTAATLFSCYRELGDQPAVLMRPPAPKNGKRVLLEKVTIIWKHLSFTWKSTVRNLLRYKKRFFMTVFGISGCMALMIVGYGIRDSVYEIAEIQYEDIQTYDGQIILQEDLTDEEYDSLEQFLDKNQDVDSYMEAYMMNLILENGSHEHQTYVMVMEDMEHIGEYVDFHDRKTKERYTLDDNGAIISEKTAKLLGAEVGDTIEIRDEDSGNKEVRIAQICENYMGHYLYLSPGYYEKIYGKAPEYNSILFVADQTLQKEGIETAGEKIISRDEVLSISYTHEIEKRLDDMLKSLNLVIIVLIISAGMLAFVVLYNLNTINITERQRELATLKVLGFYDSEVASYVFRENILLTFIGAAAGVILGKILHLFVIQTVEVDAAMFGRVINLPSYFYSLMFTVGFSLLINGIMYFKLKKINMVESLKSVE